MTYKVKSSNDFFVGNSVYIPLTGKTSNDDCTIIDRKNYEKVKNIPFHLTTTGYAKNSKKGYLHTIILPKVKNMTVDHINGNKLDNRENNLRYASQQENSSAFRIRRKGSSNPYRGVFRTKNGNWRARTRIKNIDYHLGTFVNSIDAAKAYDIAVLKLNSKFCVLNFPENLSEYKKLIKPTE